MAETVTEPPVEPVPADEQPLVAPVRAHERSYRARFRLAFVALGLVLGAAVAGFVVLVAKPGKPPEPDWSAWRPGGEAESRAQEIADHVAGGYRLASGSQLVTVQAASPRVQDIPLGAIAVRTPPASGSGEVSVDVFPVESTQVYILCGLGQDCAIEEGTPSPARLRLLRREALELALYTFRYLDETETVVAFLPPGSEDSWALFFQRGELADALDRPLRATLPDEIPPPPERIRPVEVEVIDRLTELSLFRFSFQQLQDGTAVLVLDDLRLPPSETEESQGDEQPADGTTTQ